MTPESVLAELEIQAGCPKHLLYFKTPCRDILERILTLKTLKAMAEKERCDEHPGGSLWKWLSFATTTGKCGFFHQNLVSSCAVQHLPPSPDGA